MTARGAEEREILRKMESKVYNLFVNSTRAYACTTADFIDSSAILFISYRPGPCHLQSKPPEKPHKNARKQKYETQTRKK